MRSKSALVTSAIGALVTGLLLQSALPASAATIASRPEPVGGYARSGPAVSPNVDGLVPHAGTGMHAAATPPAAVSLRQWTVAPGDQKQVGSCTTWAIGYSMLGWYSVYNGSATTYAPMYLYSQDHYPNDGGSTTSDAYRILATQGIAPRSAYSQGDYDYTHRPTAAEKAAAAAHKATLPHYLYNVYGSATPGTAGRVAIETAIAAKHPVALAIPIFEPFFRLTAAHATLHASAIPKGAMNYGGHVVLVVGYTATGVVIENQWGTAWGAEGYATLDWAFVERYSYEASWIYGFASSLPASAPAQVDAFATTVGNSGTNSSSVAASWHGTAGYEDAFRHPVTGYAVTLTGDDGSTQSADSSDPTDRSASFSGLQYGTTYTLTVAATNAVGTGVPQSRTFTPSTYGADGTDTQDAVPGQPLPIPAMPGARPTPVLAPATPVTGWPALTWSHLTVQWSRPGFTGHSAISTYRVTIAGKRSGRTVYSHTSTLGSSHRSLTVSWRSSAHRSSASVPAKLPTYVVGVQARNAAGRWSTVASITITVHWGSRGFWYSERRG